MPTSFHTSGILSLWQQDSQGQTFIPRIEEMLREASVYDLEDLSGTPTCERQASDPVQQTMAILDKIITRGTPTWVDHEVEQALRALGRDRGWLLPGQEADHFSPNMLRLFPDEAKLDRWLREAQQCLWASPESGAVQPADRRQLDGLIPNGSSSDEEWLFFRAFVEVLGPNLAWRLRPQPLFEELFGEVDQALGPDRRPDFALKAGPVKWIFEIDGLRKYEEGYELASDNQHRDEALRKHGWKVARISTTDCRERAKEWVSAWWLGESSDCGDVLTEEEREWCGLFAEPTTLADSPAWSLLLIPHYVQAISSALVHLVRMGCLAPGIRQRVLILAEQSAPFRLAFGHFLRLWNALGNLNPALPKPPEFMIQILGGKPELDEGLPLPIGRLDYVTKAEEAYDLIISFAPNLFAGMGGPLESTQTKELSGPRVRWRRSLAPPKPTQLWSASPLTHLSIDESSWVKQLFEEELENGVARSGLPLDARAKQRALQIKEALAYFLRAIFRKPDSRPGQFEAIARVLAGNSTLVLLPTGSGKSLVYQLAGLLLPGMAIVVDPLVSLMRDQVHNLKAIHVDRAAHVTSMDSVIDRVAIQEELGEGKKAYVFISPHRLQIAEFRETLKEVSRRFPISLAVIDEAHCVSEWGHDFMTPYLLLGRNIREFAQYQDGSSPIFLGLTGTASFAVLTDVQLELEIHDQESIILPQSFDRHELRFEVIHAPSEPNKRIQTIKDLKHRVAEKFQASYAAFFSLNAYKTAGGLVFCPHANGSRGVKAVANALGWRHFFAGSKPREFDGDKKAWDRFKMTVQEGYKNNRFQELVTTKSFGMGIDKPNIRYTIHFTIPGSVEAYYQEAGRAGRDQNEAWCFLLFDKDQPEEDLKVQEYFLRKNFPDAAAEHAAADQLWRKTLAPELRPLEEGRTKRILVPYAPTSQNDIEKALARLVWLKVVENYAVDYRAKHFAVTARRSTPEEVKEALSAYFMRYIFEGEVEERVQTIPLTSTAEAVREALRLLIDFAYTEIKAKREQALNTLAQLCRDFQNERAFRQGILDYLQESEFSKELRDHWLRAGWNELGEEAVLTMISNQRLKDRDAARRLVGTLRRLLDDSPRNIPLRVLSVLARSRICESPQDERSVAEEALALAAHLKLDGSHGVEDPRKIMLFAIKQADALQAEPWEGEEPVEQKYIPGLYSELTDAYARYWNTAADWRFYLRHLRTLPYTRVGQVKNLVAADILNNISGNLLKA